MMDVHHRAEDCAQISRREAMRRGLYGAGGLLLADGLAGQSALRASEPGAAQPVVPAKAARAKSVIQIFLWGGMSHNDTWDPKPDSGSEYLGEFTQVIPTNVPGILLGGLFPQLAQQADKFSLIRSMTHGNNGHETAAYLMQTGHPPGGRLAYPSVGAVFALLKRDEYQGMIPPYVVLTRAQGRFSEEGFLGPKFKPFATGGNPNASRFEVEGVVAPGISDDRQRARRELLGKMNTMENLMAACPEVGWAEEARDAAYELILGAGKEVFELDREKPELRDRYGRHTFGQECIVARRLVEAGVPYIVINYPGGWDTHSNHFATMKRQCPQLDQGLAALLADLHDRGLLDSTLVWCTGEFGRGPKVDWQPPWNGGRNHYGKVFTVLVAGGGFRGGCVVGSSDEKAEVVAERPVYPVDLLGSIYQLAGIDYTASLPHPEGLEARVLPEPSDRVKSGGLLTEIM
jgi:acetyl esterase/lipase